MTPAPTVDHLRGEVRGIPLSPRELQVLGLMRQFRNRHTVATLLGISPSTVKQHLYMVNRKQGAPLFHRAWAA